MSGRSPATWILGLCFAAVACGCSSRLSVAIDNLQDADPTVRAEAARTLAEIGGDDELAISALSKAVDDSDADVRRLASHALGQASEQNSPASVKALRPALSDPDQQVRVTAAYSLVNIAPQEEAAADVLVEAMRQGDVRAIVALGRMGPAAKSAVPALIETGQTTRLLVRIKTFETLGRIGPAAADAVPMIETGLRASDLEVRRAAIDALEAIRNSEAGNAKREV